MERYTYQQAGGTNILKDKEGQLDEVGALDKNKSFFQKEWPSIHFTEGALRSIRDILLERDGFDLDSYKDKCIQRRISLRIRTSGTKTPEGYIELLKKDEREVKKLLDTLTINVTEFFRNGSTFDKLREVVLPDIFAMREPEKTVRIWSAGCASGEEPYTVAMILKEFFPDELKRFNVSITASDVDEAILKKAVEGVFTREKVTGVDRLMRDRFFEEDGDRFKIIQDIRNMVSFKREDIFTEKAERETDLIICRNMLIYFSKEKQEWVLKEFWKNLRPGGFLLLGRSEILVGDSRTLFSTVCPRERVYRKAF